MPLLLPLLLAEKKIHDVYWQNNHAHLRSLLENPHPSPAFFGFLIQPPLHFLVCFYN